MVFPVKKYRITGRSMEPTFRHGDCVLVSSLAYLFSRPQKDHIVVAAYPDRQTPIIKRIAEIKGSRVFLQGDNPMQSTDSHTFGWIDRDRILGKVLYTLPVVA